MRAFRTKWTPKAQARLVWQGRRYKLVGALIGSEHCGHQIGASALDVDNCATWALSDSDATQHGIGPLFWSMRRRKGEATASFRARWQGIGATWCPRPSLAATRSATSIRSTDRRASSSDTSGSPTRRPTRRASSTPTLSTCTSRERDYLVAPGDTFYDACGQKMERIVPQDAIRYIFSPDGSVNYQYHMRHIVSIDDEGKPKKLEPAFSDRAA